jgi:putative ABC transport system permease protein
MTRPDGVRRLFRLLDTPRTAARAVDDELRFHLETRVAELVAAGVPAAEAERQAAREFGDVGAAREELATIDRQRLRRGGRAEWWGGWGQDVRYAIRSLRRQPAFTATVLLTIALAVGVSGAIFSALDAALLRPLPYRDPDHLVALWQTSARTGEGHGNSSYPNLLDWRRRTTTLAGIAGYHSNRMVLGEGDEPRVLWVGKTTANFFDVLGVRPTLGRFFAEGDDAIGGPRVVVLSHELWRREFAGDAGIVGRAVRLDGASYTVLGVLPEGFHFARVGAAEAWVPFDQRAAMRENREADWFDVVARLRPGATPELAGRDMRAVARDLARLYPGENGDVSLAVAPLRDDLTGAVRPLLLVLFGAAGLVLLVALANVANLLLVRGAARQRELATRAALGAGRGRIVRQLLVESTLLGLGGGAIGLGIAQLGVRALVRAIPPQRLIAMPYLADVGVNGRLVAYLLAVSLGAGVLFGLVPAFRAARPRLYDVLRDAARGSSEGGAVVRLRDALVAAELALTVVLLAGAVLFGKSLARVLAERMGFRAERVLTAFIPLPRVAYASPTSKVAFFTRVEERVRAMPGVASVGVTSKLPLDAGNTTSFRVLGDPEPPPQQEPGAAYRSVTPGYFRALGIPLLRGRLLEARTDSAAPREMVISESLARRYFAGRDPIGRQIGGAGTRPWTIVGVVGDVTIARVGDAAQPTMYWPFPLVPEVGMRLVVRTSGDASGGPEPTAALEAAVRAAVREVDPQVALYQVYTMDSLVQQSESVFMRRFPLLLMGAFAATALALAVVGTYGVVSYAVAQRRRELGIRVALGASTGSVVTLVARHTTALAAAGIAAGTVAALALSHFAASLLYDVRPTDPATYALTALLLGMVAALAAVLPARRAARVDPVVTLRDE